jgi:CPA2 family monovalent cation:H+ antiporter-2
VHDSSALLIELGIVLAALATLAALARRFGYSPVPLYLAAGLALGPGGVTPVPAAGAFVQTGASIGVILLLLTLGLEFTIGEFTASTRRHIPSAWADFGLNATPGAVAGWLLGLGWTGSLAMAGITWVSSSGIIARLLGDLRRLANRETPAVLSVLVLEDVAMAAFLPLLAVLTAGGTWWQAAISVAAAISAVTLAFAATHRLSGSLGRVLDTDDPELLLLRVLSLTLLVAGVTELMQASAAVGAFLVGLALTGQVADRTRRVVTPLRDLFAAVFFLAIGLSVDPRDMLPVLPAVVMLAAVTTATKVATGWYAAAREGAAARGRLRAGTALIARGEFSLVIASLATAPDHAGLSTFTAAYVIVLGVLGPLATRLADTVARRRN